jgi:hypothetical protein
VDTTRIPPAGDGFYAVAQKQSGVGLEGAPPLSGGEEGVSPVVHGSAARAKAGMATTTAITAMTSATVRINKMRFATSYLLTRVR